MARGATVISAWRLERRANSLIESTPTVSGGGRCYVDPGVSQSGFRWQDSSGWGLRKKVLHRYRIYIWLTM